MLSDSSQPLELVGGTGGHGCVAKSLHCGWLCEVVIITWWREYDLHRPR